MATITMPPMSPLKADPKDKQAQNPFALFTKPTEIQARLQQQLPVYNTGQITIQRCQIEHARYRTYTKPKHQHKAYLAICYILQVTDAQTQQAQQQIIHLRAFRQGRSLAAYAQAKQAPLATPQFGLPLVHLPDLDAVVWAFPNDPKLLHLPELLQAEAVKAHLPYHTLPAAFSTPAAISHLEPDVVHYYPEERCTTRYYLQTGPNNSPQQLIIYGKTFKDDGGYPIYQRMKQLWQHPLPKFKVARPLAYDAELKTIWQAHQPGEPLVNLLNRHNYRPLLNAVICGLVSLQYSGLRSSRHQTLHDHQHNLEEKVKKLGAALPDQAAALTNLQDMLIAEMAHLPPAPTCLMYGDFHSRQILVERGQPIFFDFDEFSMGDPIYDLANFIVDLHFQNFAADFIQAMTETLCQAYHDQSPEGLSERRLRWYLCFLFITKAYRLYRRQQTQLASQVSDIIQLAQQSYRHNTYAVGRNRE